MRIKRQGYISITILLVILLVSLCLIGQIRSPQLDRVKVNDFVKSIEEGANQETIDTLKEENGFDYYYLEGKLVVYSDAKTGLLEIRLYAMIGLAMVVIIAIALILVNLYSINKKIMNPFRKLKKFAEAIAKGDLDAPLQMDQENIFGAFTESFDIMREELAIARENEKKANASKKELVASLSHDIKTPLASIKAITELLLVKEKENGIVDRLHSIDQKTGQIEVLVNNLFHATLEELEEIKVTKEEVSSLTLVKLLRNGDSNNRINQCEVKECLVVCDPLRLQQVFDNIISNSYKYADSDIMVSSFLEYGYLNIVIEDYGKGIAKEELALIKQKYYRGSNAEGKNGAGIGLYISNYFMEKMGGFLRVANGDTGFQVIVGTKMV